MSKVENLNFDTVGYSSIFVPMKSFLFFHAHYGVEFHTQTIHNTQVHMMGDLNVLHVKWL